MQSTWKTPRLGRKPRTVAKPRPRGQSGAPAHPQTLLSAAAASARPRPSTARTLWTGASEEKASNAGRKGERSQGASKALHLHHHHLHHHQTRSSDLHRDPAPQPPISKMDSCHISEDRGPWSGILTGTGIAASGLSPPPPAHTAAADTGALLRGGGPRLRLGRQGKSRGRGVSRGGEDPAHPPFKGKDTSSLDATETDGYFSDGEQSDSDARSNGRKLRLAQLHSGNEDLLRRSVLAS